MKKLTPIYYKNHLGQKEIEITNVSKRAQIFYETLKLNCVVILLLTRQKLTFKHNLNYFSKSVFELRMLPILHDFILFRELKMYKSKRIKMYK